MSNKQRKPMTFVCLVVMICLAGCIDEIGFGLGVTGEQAKRQLVVDGRITNGPGPHIVKLSRTPGGGKKTQPVVGATLWIIDNVGNREPLVEMGEGTYSSEDRLVGEKGRSYSLEIDTGDGSIYRSRPDTMPFITAKDSAYVKVVREEELSSSDILIDVTRAKVFLDSEVPVGPIYLKWNVVHTFARTSPDPEFPNCERCFIWCYPSVAVSPQDFVLSKGADVSFRIEERLVGSKKANNDFYYNNAFVVIQSSLSVRAHEYWEKVSQVVNSVGSIFDVPGATVPGNVFNPNDPDEEILGYFEAVARDTSNVFVSRFDFPSGKVVNPCMFFTSPQIREECHDCLRIPGSSLEIPGYWPD